MMFEDFSFGPARSPSMDSIITTSTTSDRSHSRSVSPCSPLSPWPTPQYTVTDLASDLCRQKLRQDSQIYTQPCDAYANLDDDDAGWTLEDQETADLPTTLDTRRKSTRSYSPIRRRLDRQAHSRLLCSSTHHRDIAALVTRMVHREEQCMVQPPTSVCYTASPTSEREGGTIDVASLSRVSSTLSLTSRTKDHRRPSDMHKTGASISKDVRFRKDLPRRQKSSDK